MINPIHPVYRDDDKIIFRTEDLFYPNYPGKFFVLRKSEGYGYFQSFNRKYTRGEILDEFGITIEKP